MAKGYESRLITISGIEFTVNTAATDAPLSLSGGGPAPLSVNGATRNIQYGDNCIIKGFALTFPYQFGQGQIATDGLQIGLDWIDATGLNTGNVTEIGDGGRLNISDPNQWYDVDIFIPQPAAVAQKWRLEVAAINGDVSQIYAPAVLDTEVLFCTFHLLILTTLPLIA